MKKIAYLRPDGGVSIVIPVPKETIEKTLGSLTDAEYEAHVRDRSIPKDAVSVRDIEDDEIPQDRSFRNAWKLDLSVDMDKAREIHMARIRKVRDQAMAVLDIETMKGRDVQDQKQVLRDLPQTFKLNTAKTPDELKNMWPVELNREA